MDYKQKITLEKPKVCFLPHDINSIECRKEPFGRQSGLDAKERKNEKCQKSLAETEPQSGGRKQRKIRQFPNFLMNKGNQVLEKNKFRYSKPIRRNSQAQNDSLQEVQKDKGEQFLTSTKKFTSQKRQKCGWNKFSLGSEKASQQKEFHVIQSQNKNTKHQNLSNSEDYGSIIRQIRGKYEKQDEKTEERKKVNYNQMSNIKSVKSSSNIKDSHSLMYSPKFIGKKKGKDEIHSFSMKNINGNKNFQNNFNPGILLFKNHKENNQNSLRDSPKFDSVPSLDLNTCCKKIKFIPDLKIYPNKEIEFDKHGRQKGIETPRKSMGNHRLIKSQENKKTMNLRKYLKAQLFPKSQNQIELINPFSLMKKMETFKVLKVLIKSESTQISLVKEKFTSFIYCLKKCLVLPQKNDEDENGTKDAKESLNDAIECLIREAKISQIIDHPNIIKTFCCLVDQDHIYHLMEYMQGSSLQQRIQQKFFNPKKNSQKRKNSQKIAQIRIILSQLINAVEFLHQMNIIHRDIKPSNIFISHESNIKLGDFGISLYEKPKDFFGTLDYASPEMILHEEYDKSVDIWAIGCVAYELFTGRPPFYNENERLTTINLVNCRYDLKQITDQNLSNLISQMLQRNPQNRPSCKDIQLHAFFTEKSLSPTSKFIK